MDMAERAGLAEALRARLAAAGLEVPPGDDAGRLERDLALHLERVADLAAAADLGPDDPPRTDPTTAVERGAGRRDGRCGQPRDPGRRVG